MSRLEPTVMRRQQNITGVKPEGRSSRSRYRATERQSLRHGVGLLLASVGGEDKPTPSGTLSSAESFLNPRPTTTLFRFKEIKTTEPFDIAPVPERNLLITQPSRKHGCRGLLAIIQLDHLHRRAHVAGDLKHANSISQCHHCVEMSKAIKRILLAETVSLYSSLL